VEVRERVDSYCFAEIKKGLFNCKEGRERERERERKKNRERNKKRKVGIVKSGKVFKARERRRSGCEKVDFSES
jgi:hypothetical protein